MGYLSQAKDISEVTQPELWVIYGKSGSGKTALGGTFPKPMLYVKIGDDGSNTIKSYKGIKTIEAHNPKDAKEIAKELLKDTKYKSVFFDTFSLITNEWVNENAVTKNKRMTQQMWGDLKTDTEEVIRLLHQVAETHVVVLSCHEAADAFEGMEDEILPDIRPSVTKGARTYLEGMANYGIHCIKVTKEIDTEEGTKEVTKFGVNLGANPYYWTKLQIDPSIKVPKMVFNPSYDKIIKLITGGKEHE